MSALREHVSNPRASPGPPKKRPGTASLREIVDAAQSAAVTADASARSWVSIHPRPARDAQGDPVLSLVLLLERRPGPEDDTVFPLIRDGSLSLELTLGATPDELRALDVELGGLNRSLFIRRADVALRSLDGPRTQLLASGLGTPPDGRVALAANLGQEGATAVLGALDAMPGPLVIEAEAWYSARSRELLIRLAGAWETVHGFLSQRIHEDATVTRGDLRSYLVEMARQGVIALTGASADEISVEPALDQVFRAFLQVAGPVLSRETPELPPDADGNRYTLRPRPSSLFQLQLEVRVASAEERSVRLRAPLHEILGNQLGDRDRNRFIRLLSPDPGGNGIGPPPVRVRSTSRPRGPADIDPEPIALVEGTARSLRATLRPSSQAPTSLQALLLSDAVRPARPEVVGAWLVEDAVIERPEEEAPAHLPVVTDPAAPLWQDRVDSTTYWYAPKFSPVIPSPSADPASSPFLLTYRETGVVMTGTDLQRSLEAVIRFTLEMETGDATREALVDRGSPPARAVEVSQVAVSLELPFRDQTGKDRVQAFPASVERDAGTVKATVALLDDWVRLAYGALAEPDFQQRSATLVVTYAYPGYAPVKADQTFVAYGGKTALTPVVYSSQEKVIATVPHFDAAAATYRFPAGEVRLVREVLPVDAGEPTHAGPGRLTTSARPISAVALAAVVPVAVEGPTFSARPVIVSPVNLAQLLQRTTYARRSFVRQERVPVLFPCEELGALYRESRETGDESIGCRDALTLGQTTYRQYQEVVGLRDASYRVYRSLQQPGRFLVIPKTYRITRYGATAGAKAYRPVVFVYSVLDPAEPENVRVVFHASLQPDIAVGARRHLRRRLLDLASDPIIEYPTEIESATDYTWTLDERIAATPTVVRMPDSLQVATVTDLTGALLLRDLLRTSGLQGTATLNLPDGMSLSVGLEMSLRNIVGPWESGPIEVVIGGGSVQLNNRIERSIAVRDLEAYGSSGDPHLVPVDATLAPMSSLSVRVPEGTSEAYVVGDPVPGEPAALEEVRSFVEDVRTNAVFIDLIDHGAHDLESLSVRARVRDRADPAVTVPMTGDPPIGELDFLLPLTGYVAERVLEYQVTKRFSSGESTDTGWLQWDMRTLGNVVSLTWDAIR